MLVAVVRRMPILACTVDTTDSLKTILQQKGYDIGQAYRCFFAITEAGNRPALDQGIAVGCSDIDQYRRRMANRCHWLALL